MRITKSQLIKLIKEAVTETLSTRRALEDQEIEDSFDLAYDEPISKAEKDWEAEQNRLAGDDEEGLWAVEMKRKYGEDWEDILQNAAIDKMLSKSDR